MALPQQSPLEHLQCLMQSPGSRHSLEQTAGHGILSGQLSEAWQPCWEPYFTDSGLQGAGQAAAPVLCSCAAKPPVRFKMQSRACFSIQHCLKEILAVMS